MKDALTLGDVAEAFGVQLWRLQRVYERGLLPQPPKFGGRRYVTKDDLPAIEAALIKGGYLKPEAVSVA